MILGIGIDAIEINRFAHWALKPLSSLKRVFSDVEIAYCLPFSNKSAERFAARFAAKEAFFKALQPLLKQPIHFVTLCRYVSVIKLSNGYPQLQVNWEKIHLCLSDATNLKIHVSLTHTKTTAIAVVIIEQ